MVDGKNNASRFVAEDMCSFNDHRPDASSVPEVDVGPMAHS